MKLTEQIEICDYDPSWPEAYGVEAVRLRHFAEGVLVGIEHFGSTAIPGLRAKPTIDIMGVVADLSDLEPFATRLRVDGYVEMSENFSFRRFFRKERASRNPSFHLHLVEEGVWQHKSERLFRDWLVSHPEVARSYEKLKDKLASRFADDREAYTEAKNDFVRATVNEARKSIGLSPLIDWEE